MTRMWMVDPKVLCRNHLLGEHKELHMLVGSIRKGRNLGKHLTLGNVDPTYIEVRHEQIVEEMKRREYNHKSPLPEFEYDGPPSAGIDVLHNLRDLAERCEACRARLQAQGDPDKTRRTLTAALREKRAGKMPDGRLVLCGGGPPPWFDALLDLRETGDLNWLAVAVVMG